MNKLLLVIALALATPAQAMVPGVIFSGVGVKALKNNFAVGIAPTTAITINTGVANTNLGALTHVALQLGNTRAETSAASAESMYGFFSAPGISAANTQNLTASSSPGLAGGVFFPRISTGATGTVTSVMGLWNRFLNNGAAVTTYQSFQSQDPTGTGTITNNLGAVIAAQTKGTNNTAILLGTTTAPSGNYAIHSTSAYDSYLAGTLGIGVVSPSAKLVLDVTSTTKALAPPRMTTTQKNAITSPVEGSMVYDLTLHKLSVYTGSVWETVTSL